MNASNFNFSRASAGGNLRRLRRSNPPASANDPPLGTVPKFLTENHPHNIFPRTMRQLKQMTDEQIDSFCDFYGIARPPAGVQGRVMTIEDIVCGF
jgi:hypothetical protein